MSHFWRTWRTEIVRGTALFCGVLGIFWVGRHLVGRARDSVAHNDAFTALRDLRGQLADVANDMGDASHLKAADHAPHWSGATWMYHTKVAPHQWVWIRNLHGSVTVEPTKGNSVEIIASKNYRWPADSTSVRFMAEPYEGGVAVCAVWSGATTPRCGPKSEDYQAPRSHKDVTVDFKVRLPARVRLGASTVIGDLHVTGARAPLWLRTVSGEVDATTAQGPVDARSINGSVRVRVEGFADTGVVSAQTVNGSVTAELPAWLDADVHAHTNNGSLSTDYGLPVTGKFVGQEITATLGRGGRKVTLMTINGSVRLTKIQ